MSLFDQIHAIASNANKWRSKMLFKGHVPSFLSFSDQALCPSVGVTKGLNTKALPPPTLHSICDYNTKMLVSFKNGDSFMFDPAEYPDAKASTVNRLKTDLIEAARLAGFKLRRSGKAPERVYFRCDHNKIICNIPERQFMPNKHQQEGTLVISQRNKSTKNAALKKSPQSRPVGLNIHKRKRINATGGICEDTRCPFQFLTVFSRKDKAWYLRTDCNGNVEDNGTKRDPNAHRGHCRVDPGNVKTDLISLSKAELELATQCQGLFVNDKTIADLLELQRGGDCRFTKKQMQYLKAKMKAHTQLNNFSNGKSSAENLINSFDDMIAKGDDIQYIALTHSYKDGFRIVNSRGRPCGPLPNGQCELLVFLFYSSLFLILNCFISVF